MTSLDVEPRMKPSEGPRANLLSHSFPITRTFVVATVAAPRMLTAIDASGRALAVLYTELSASGVSFDSPSAID